MSSISRPSDVSNTYQATGVAKDNYGNEQLTYNPLNNFEGAPEIRVTFSNTGTNHAARTNLKVFPKITDLTATTLPEGVVCTSTFGNFANFVKFIDREDFQVVEMRIQTDDTGHFTGDLEMGETRIDGVDVPEKVNLTKYRVSTGNGYSDVITITDKKFINKARFYMLLSSLKDNKEITFYFKVAGVSAMPMVQPK